MLLPLTIIKKLLYTFNGFCKTVIRFAAINAWRDRSRRRQKEISLEYLTEEKSYPLGATDEYFEAPYEDQRRAGSRGRGFTALQQTNPNRCY